MSWKIFNKLEMNGNITFLKIKKSGYMND